jgi:hypothetical protein
MPQEFTTEGTEITESILVFFPVVSALGQSRRLDSNYDVEWRQVRRLACVPLKMRDDGGYN